MTHGVEGLIGVGGAHTHPLISYFGSIFMQNSGQLCVLYSLLIGKVGDIFGQSFGCPHVNIWHDYTIGTLDVLGHRLFSYSAVCRLCSLY